MTIGPIRVEWVLFALMLFGVALFHRRAMLVALIGLVAVGTARLVWDPFSPAEHFAHEWKLLANLFGLLLGFAVLASHFEHSGFPDWLPRVLPDGWRGGLALLAVVFVLSTVLDNIAGALIGATIARAVFRDRIHVGYLAAIVAAANAGGAPSVVGDTTTTMIWLAGHPAFALVPAAVASVAALAVFGVFGAKQQDRLQPIVKDAPGDAKIRAGTLFVVSSILAGAILANVYLDHQPAIGVWGAILLTAPFVRPHWRVLKTALPGAVFLCALVLTASLMPVDDLPPPSWLATLGLGFLSAVFDNIPLTKLALDQGGHDWALLAYAVGFGGSMTWFGSSAGVAVANLCPEARSVGSWLRHGWHVPLAYVVGFFVYLAAFGVRAGAG